MRIVIAGASGNIGSRIVNNLLNRGEAPVMIARNADKVSKFVARGATLVQAASDDAEKILVATRNADALFWMTPPVLEQSSLKGWYARTAAIAAQAIAINGIKRVVHISSIGAGARPGLGTVSYTGDVEVMLADESAHLINLRPGYFMQNLANALPRLYSDAVLELPFLPDHDIPWISTDDIGDVATAYLIDQEWAGKWARNLMGPENVTPRQIAEIMSDILKKTVHYRQVTLQQIDDDLAKLGANTTVRAEMNMLMQALGDADGIYATSRTPDAVTPTTLRGFLANVLKTP